MNYEEDHTVIANRRAIHRYTRWGNASRLIVLGHGGYPVSHYFNEEGRIVVPPGITVYHYIPHRATMGGQEGLDKYDLLSTENGLEEGRKEYRSSQLIKNYTLKAIPFDMANAAPNAVCSLLFPVDSMYTKDIFDLLLRDRNQYYQYKEIHFLTCRSITVTLPFCHRAFST